MATKTIEELFEITFVNRWAGKAREEVEQRNIKFWLKMLPKTTRGLSLGVIDKVILAEVKKGNKPSTINSKLQTLKPPWISQGSEGFTPLGSKFHA
tara:strand:+ start:47 stop:334 length:288 start_codon:yes stop_codon:yes gene_type:complete